MKRLKKSYIWILSVLFVFSVIYFSINPSALRELYETVGLKPAVSEGNLNIFFIDVGQGDAALITDGEHNVLIDAGDITSKAIVETFLVEAEVDKLDVVIASHAHSDHIGEMAAILNRFETGKVYLPSMSDKVIPTTVCFNNMLDAIEDNNIESELLVKGDNFTVGDIEFEVLSPSKLYDDLNNTSLVLRVSYFNTSFLFCGDAEELVENDILENDLYLSSDLIKIGHHGSNTSSSQKFLNKVSPDYAIISVGEDNRYNHPSKITLNKLKDMNIKYYRTDIYGTICVISDGNNLEIKTEK